MASSIQVKRGTTANVAAYTPLSGELVLDTTTNKLYAGDGSTAGGVQVVASKKGVVDASAAASGEVGEVLTATGTLTSHTTATTRDLVALSLTPGDWEVSGRALYDVTSGSIATAITGIGTTSSSVDAWPNRVCTGGASSYDLSIPVRRRFNVSANTTIYLSGYCEISSGTVASNGYLEARRVR